MLSVAAPGFASLETNRHLDTPIATRRMTRCDGDVVHLSGKPKTMVSTRQSEQTTPLLGSIRRSKREFSPYNIISLAFTVGVKQNCERLGRYHPLIKQVVHYCWDVSVPCGLFG